jgi:hypothetical protein
LATFFAALLSFFADLTGAFFVGAFLAAFLNAIASGCGRGAVGRSAMRGGARGVRTGGGRAGDGFCGRWLLLKEA